MPKVMTLVQRHLDKSVPNPTAQKYIWFVLLWCFGLGAVVTFAYFLRSILFLAQ